MGNEFWSYSLPIRFRIAENEVRVYLDGEYVKSVPVLENGSFSTTLRLDLAEMNDIRVRAVDLDGNSSTFSDLKSVKVDLLPPRLELDCPSDGFFRRSEDLVLRGTVEDPSVENVEVELGERTWTLEVVENKFQANLKLENGYNSIAVRAVDSAGNVVERTLEGFYGPFPGRLDVLFGDIRPGRPRTVELTDHSFLREVEVSPGIRADNFRVGVESVPSLPKKVSRPAGTPLFYLKMVPSFSGVVDDAELTFRVEKGWVDSENISLGSMCLYESTDNGWKPLPSIFKGEDVGWYYFKSTVDEFSLFSLVGKRAEHLEEPFYRGRVFFGIMGLIVMATFAADLVFWRRDC